MPEQKHYITEDLNRGYIYTNVQSIIVKKEDYNPNIIKHLKSTRKDCYKDIKLKSFYKTRADYGDITASFFGTFEKVACARFPIVGDFTFFKQNIEHLTKAGYVFNPKDFKQDIIADTLVKSEKLDEIAGEIKPEETVKLSIAGNDLYDMFKQVIKNNIGSFAPKRSVPSAREAIYKWFRKYFGSKEWDEEIVTIQHIFLNLKNREMFEQVLAEAVEKYKAVKEAEVRSKIIENWDSFEVPVECFFNEHTDEKVDVKKHLHTPCYLTANRSQPERDFEYFLEKNTKHIAWWWKNGENKRDFFGIRYEYEGGIHTCYPDYLAQCADGRLGIFEVKDPTDRDGKTWTKTKAEELQKYIVKHDKNLFGGIVIKKNDIWKINDKKTYDWSKCERSDWSDWKDLKL